MRVVEECEGALRYTVGDIACFRCLVGWCTWSGGDYVDRRTAKRVGCKSLVFGREEAEEQTSPLYMHTLGVI
jgi:hypothetical protein